MSLSGNELMKIMQCSPMLDGVEAELLATHPQIVEDSIALQRDCGIAYMDLPVEKEVTQARVQEVFLALFNAYRGLPAPQKLNELRAALFKGSREWSIMGDAEKTYGGLS